MHADYPYNGWETYLFFLLLLLFIWAAIGLGYGVSPVFSSFIHRKSVYFFSFLILSSIEAYLLFFCMVENFSLEQVFSLKGENQATLLIIPLLFIFIIPILFLLNRKQQKP
ncbi:MAG: hypothetical protein LUE93_15190 [Bacteroides sp.]|nr:hypothetical protein [Bacteroides sp.]